MIAESFVSENRIIEIAELDEKLCIGLREAAFPQLVKYFSCGISSEKRKVLRNSILKEVE